MGYLIDGVEPVYAAKKDARRHLFKFRVEKIG